MRLRPKHLFAAKPRVQRRRVVVHPSPHSTRSAVTQFDSGDNDRRAAASAAAISLTPWDPLD
jgi:hypothetical protein